MYNFFSERGRRMHEFSINPSETCHFTALSPLFAGSVGYVRLNY